MSGPLDGIRVVEVANWLAAPLGAAVLADMGAAVVKVEAPQGDAVRGFQAPGASAEHLFNLYNRGKRGITANLDHPDGRAVVRRLVERADVFITNLTPTRVERYELTYDALAARNPRLIYANLTGYGVHGPERDRLGFDYAAFWARSGIMGIIGPEHGPPPLQRPGMGDHTTGVVIACGVLAALLDRQRTGRGQQVNFSLLNSGLWVLATDIQMALVTSSSMPRHNREAPPNPIWNTYRCADGRWILLVMIQADRYWPKFCAAIERPDLEHDPRFNSMTARQAHNAELVRILDAVFATATLKEWGERLDRHGAIWAPVQTLAEATNDPQARANGYFTAIEHPSLGRMETLQAPFRFGVSEVTVRGPAPELGQHTEEVLLELGYSWEEIVALRDRGAI